LPTPTPSSSTTRPSSVPWNSSMPRSSMSNRGAVSRAFLIRFAIILLLGAGAVAFVLSRRPMQIAEEKVRSMIASGELVGLPVGRAVERLQHKADYQENGTVTLDFEQVPEWTLGPVVLDVKDGTVTGATFARDRKPPGKN